MWIHFGVTRKGDDPPLRFGVGMTTARDFSRAELPKMAESIDYSHSLPTSILECLIWLAYFSKYVKQKNHFSPLPNCKVSRVSALKAILESQNKDWTRQHILSHVQSKPLSAPKRSHLRQHWKSPNQISTMINSDMINLVDQNSIVFLKI